MSLRYALLGLLAENPQTGYELTKHFETVLSRYAWSASHSQIYPELKKMTDDGLVAVVDEGARGSRTFAVTETGREQLREWMLEPTSETPARNGFVLRLFLLTALEPADTRALVRRVVKESDEEIAGLRDMIAQIDAEAGDGRTGWARFAAEYGVRWFALQRDWAEWVEDQLDAPNDQ